MQKIQLIIPEPCHENWNQMLPNEQGRFCNSCAKTVVDFSSMTDSQMVDYFTRLKNENVCGRVDTSQLQRPMEQNLSVRSKISFYWKYAFAFFLFAGKAQSTKAQGLMARMPVEKTAPKKIRFEENLKSFHIVDDQNNPIPNVSVKFSSGKMIMADSAGKVQLFNGQQKEMLTLTAIGFEDRVIAVSDIRLGLVTLTPAIKELENVVVTADAGLIKCSKSYVTTGAVLVNVSETKNIVRDTIFHVVNYVNPAANVYPNPVAKGGTINIDLKLSQPGMHKFTIVDAMGRLVFAQNYQLAGKKTAQQIVVPSSWAGGIYFLVVFDESGKKIAKEKIVVQ